MAGAVEESIVGAHAFVPASMEGGRGENERGSCVESATPHILVFFCFSPSPGGARPSASAAAQGDRHWGPSEPGAPQQPAAPSPFLLMLTRCGAALAAAAARALPSAVDAAPASARAASGALASVARRLIAPPPARGWAAQAATADDDDDAGARAGAHAEDVPLGSR